MEEGKGDKKGEDRERERVHAKEASTLRPKLER